MTLTEHVSKIIVPAIQAGTNEHATAMIMALVANAYRAGHADGDMYRYRDGFDYKIETHLPAYVNEGWNIVWHNE